MERDWSVRERITAGTIALIASGALALQTSINEGSALFAFALLFRFFTIWVNFVAGLMMGWIALGRRISRHSLVALASALTVVALVYHALLAADHHPVGLDWWTNQAFHTLIPAASVLWWLVFTRHESFDWGALPIAMIAPVTYTIFALAYGAASGFYPYFFLDRSALDWEQLLANITGLALFFMVISALLMGIRALVGRGISDVA